MDNMIFVKFMILSVQYFTNIQIVKGFFPLKNEFKPLLVAQKKEVYPTYKPNIYNCLRLLLIIPCHHQDIPYFKHSQHQATQRILE